MRRVGDTSERGRPVNTGTSELERRVDTLVDVTVGELIDDQRAASMLAIARTALEIDPLAARLSAAQRRERVLKLYQHAQERVTDCTAKLGTPLPPADLQAVAANLESHANDANDRSLRRDSDLIDDLFATSTNAITVTSKWCGAQPPTDQAIAGLAQVHGVHP